MSASAGDKDDWCEYFVNQFVERDMLMRFHFGLGVGHVYSHQRAMQVIVQQNDITAQSTFVGEDDEDARNSRESDEGATDNEDEDVLIVDPTEQWCGSSQSSLLEQYEEMYDSEVELDYEN
ncbi:uncharacterized protein F5147DRAFT_766475 [Suillus discolor]|uniref:Uncharacterized protein n=1 Tax=Suillus discolor TaxID=1912936 RepID=A0A9P7K0X4_9AGAM|nr:uncharacterized protein F5147DRAFT_766475 [Suillus discolor]KAG2120561.1 hypothetical protein F5147DRAFT_766475 [Suillus discolor]